MRSHLQVSDAVVDARAQEGGERVLVAYLQSAAPHEQLIEECRKLGLDSVLAPAGTEGATVEAGTLGQALAVALVEKSV